MKVIKDIPDNLIWTAECLLCNENHSYICKDNIIYTNLNGFDMSKTDFLNSLNKNVDMQSQHKNLYIEIDAYNFKKLIEEL